MELDYMYVLYKQVLQANGERVPVSMRISMSAANGCVYIYPGYTCIASYPQPQEEGELIAICNYLEELIKEEDKIFN